VNGVWWARSCEEPKFPPPKRLQGAKAAGSRYEKAVAKALPHALHGQWFEYQDAAGVGVCQPDLLFELEFEPGPLICLEVKYTWVPTAHVQLRNLYLPVVSCATERSVVGAVVARRLVGGMNGTAIVNCMADAIWAARRGWNVTLHWLGESAAPLQVPGIVSPIF
jgi:hypothetical protein